MTVLISVAAFIVTIGVLVTFHELGHYVAARLMGIKVLRFSVGFGKPLVSRTVGVDNTEWVLAAIPLGGYVRMLDGRVDEVPLADRGRAFEDQPVWRRSIVILAGPFANFLLAALIYAALFMTGVPGWAPVIAAPPKSTAAAMAGLADGERILTFDGAAVESFGELRWRTLEVAVKRGVAKLETQDLQGRLYQRRLDLSGIEPHDLERELNEKVGFNLYSPPLPTRVGRVLPNSAAAEAGLKPGDEVVSINGNPIADWQAMVRMVSASPGEDLLMVVRRAGVESSLRARTAVVVEQGRRLGRLGVNPDPVAHAAAIQPFRVTVRHGPVRAAVEAIQKTWDSSVFSLKLIGKMIMGELSWRNLSGPITIADYAGRSAVAGGMPFLEFLALISVSLGVMNLLPIPVLDGGHLLYHLAEAIKGKPISDRALEIGQRLGLGAIVLLAVFAIYNDLGRLFGAG